MLPAPIDQPLQPRDRHRAARAFRRRMAWLSVLATVVATLAASGSAPAQAAQASGDEVPAWSTGWAWTYATVFNYTADGTNVTINENVTYTVAGVETYQGQPAYRLNLTGTITGGNGTAAVDGVGNATLSNFSGSVTGTRFMRRSDLALLKETQNQSLSAKAQVSILSTNITATINLSMDPRRGWRLTQFPTEAGELVGQRHGRRLHRRLQLRRRLARRQRLLRLRRPARLRRPDHGGGRERRRPGRHHQHPQGPPAERGRRHPGDLLVLPHAPLGRPPAAGDPARRRVAHARPEGSPRPALPPPPPR
ncbi:hypothetical protein G5V59_09890 [Nocardioides sp. W3-2-3]|uniref:hypothetical protein n=1 Tax=Nocardioides convexus TaxID=2712224 RepID=UPI0024181FE9|nr:hypothetical protein [Nocardioides convexus]NHA00311.1 hypothetical protein [Nocardioides convexus]